MTLLTLAKLLHLLGLVGGFGAAALADALILRNAILRPIQQGLVEWLHHLSRIAMAGLAVLWLSGIALITIRYLEGVPVLENQKVWAKVVIVMLLTINGAFVHAFALKQVSLRVGQRLFETASSRQILPMIFIAAVSSASWISAFFLGTAVELNHKVSVGGVLSVYVLVILLIWCTLFAGCQLLAKYSGRFLSEPKHEVLAFNDSHDEIHLKYVALLQRVRAMSARSFPSQS